MNNKMQFSSNHGFHLKNVPSLTTFGRFLPKYDSFQPDDNISILELSRALKMTTFLIVQFEDKTKENEVIPSSWYHEGLCALPSKNQQWEAENCTILKMSWKRHNCKIPSTHGNVNVFRFSLNYSEILIRIYY